MRGRENIIIVEDEYIIAMDTKITLEDAGYYVSGIATSGEEAVSLCSSNSPSLVLMDIALDGRMDGIQAAETIRRASDVPVIFISGNLDENNMNRIKAIKSCSWIAKPCNDMTLTGVVEQVFDKGM